MTMTGPASLRLPDIEDSAFQATRVEAIRAQFTRMYERSAFFRGRCDGTGVAPASIRTWEDFRAIPPLLSKDDERQDEEWTRRNAGHPYGTLVTVDPGEVVGVAATSGTTGLPTFTCLYTLADLDVNTELWRRAMTWVGVPPGARVLNAFGMSVLVCGCPTVYALWCGGYQCVPVGAEAGSVRILRMLDLTRPRVLLGTPSLVEHLIERAPEIIGKPVGDLGLEVILAAGEPGAGLQEFRRKVRELYGARLYDFQGGGLGAMNVSCGEDEYFGMHELAPDLHVRAEDLRDPDTGTPMALHDGVTGTYLYTSIHQQARPAVKWKPGDLVQVYTAPCRCGFRGVRYRILGRVDDMLIVKGVNVFPASVKAIIERLHPRTTGQFRIVLDGPPPRVKPPLRIRVEAGRDVVREHAAALAEELGVLMHGELKIRSDIEIVPAGTLPRVTYKSQVLEYPGAR